MRRLAIEDSADVVIVGTGAGGATAARVLSSAGLSVVMLEEGKFLKPEERPRDAIGALATAMRDFGAQTTAGSAPIPLLQGRCVGGSTAINSGIIWRLPQDVREDWRERFDLGELIVDEKLAQAERQIERELTVKETDVSLLGGNAQVMAEACAKMDLPGKPTTRNAGACKGSAQCLQGCQNLARQSMDLSYVPMAIRNGARLHTQARVTKVLIERGRAVGVVGELVGSKGQSFRVRARHAVIVSAGALHTPLILRRSGIKRGVGDRFQAHPGVALVGLFDRSVGMNQGATQAYEVPLRDRGYKIESLSLPPEMLASRVPGCGPDWQKKVSHLDRFAQWCVQVRMEAKGTVRAGWGGRPLVRYAPTSTDLAKTQEAMGLMCEMMLRAGATEVYPNLHGASSVIRNMDEVNTLRKQSFQRRDWHMVASHLFGTAMAGGKGTKSVVGADLQCKEVPGVYVMDASVFPTNLGVNPQHSIMSVVHVAVSKLANRSLSSQTRKRTLRLSHN